MRVCRSRLLGPRSNTCPVAIATELGHDFSPDADSTPGTGDDDGTMIAPNVILFMANNATSPAVWRPASGIPSIHLHSQ